MTDDLDPHGTWAWSAALAVAAVLGSLATACMMPFAALAVSAAATMPLRRALATVGLAWAANQAIGFRLLGFPLDAHALAWGGALGGGALIALFVGRAVLGRRDATALRLAGAGALAFAAAEAALYAFALVAGGTDTFTPAIIARLGANEAIWFAGLLGLHQLLGRASPRLFGPALGTA